jgi:exodeoxyribonuclease VII small subunit
MCFRFCRQPFHWTRPAVKEKYYVTNQGKEGQMTRKTGKFNFEEALANLEALVEAMEEGDLSLEESLKAFEQGIKLTRECQAAIEQAEQKVNLLVKEGHLPESVPFDSAESED